MALKEKYTHVRRASSGLTLIEVLITVLIVFAIVIASLSHDSQYPTDVIKEVKRDSYQQDVYVVAVQPPRTAIVKMKMYGKIMTTACVYKNHYQLDLIRNPAHRYSKSGSPQSKQDWQAHLRQLMIRYGDEIHVGQNMELWYTTSIKTLRNGGQIEEVVFAEVRPKKPSYNMTIQ